MIARRDLNLRQSSFLVEIPLELDLAKFDSGAPPSPAVSGIQKEQLAWLVGTAFNNHNQFVIKGIRQRRELSYRFDSSRCVFGIW